MTSIVSLSKARKYKMFVYVSTNDATKNFKRPLKICLSSLTKITLSTSNFSDVFSLFIINIMISQESLQENVDFINRKYTRYEDQITTPGLLFEGKIRVKLYKDGNKISLLTIYFPYRTTLQGK